MKGNTVCAYWNRILRRLHDKGPQTDKALRHALGIWWHCAEGFEALKQLEASGAATLAPPTGKLRSWHWQLGSLPQGADLREAPSFEWRGDDAELASEVRASFGVEGRGDGVRVATIGPRGIIIIEVETGFGLWARDGLRVAGVQWPDATISFSPDPVDGDRLVRALTRFMMRRLLAGSLS